MKEKISKMDMRIAREEIYALKDYPAPELVKARIKLNQNESPYDIPAALKRKIAKEIGKIPLNRYYDGSSLKLRTLLAKYAGCKPENILVGNGIDEVFYYISLVFFRAGKKIIYPTPSFPIYETCAKMMGANAVPVLLNRDFSLSEKFVKESRGAVAIICNPNSPTGNRISEEGINRVIENAELTILDEAYGEFANLKIRKPSENVITLRTLSKSFSAAGLRIGYCVSSEENIRLMNKVRLPWNLNIISQRAGEIILQNVQYFKKRIREIVRERERFAKELKKYVQVFPSDANFILIKSEKLSYEKLLKKGIVVRDVSSLPMLRNCLRITVGTPPENNAVIRAVREIVQ